MKKVQNAREKNSLRIILCSTYKQLRTYIGIPESFDVNRKGGGEEGDKTKC